MSEQTKELPASVKRYATYLMVMAGLGGLLYGIDVGVIAAALPYIEKTSSYTSQQLSGVVAAVLLGSVLSSLFAGMLAEWLGRKKVIVLAALLFTLSIPVICFSNNVFWMLMAGFVWQSFLHGTTPTMWLCGNTIVICWPKRRESSRPKRTCCLPVANTTSCYPKDSTGQRRAEDDTSHLL